MRIYSVGHSSHRLDRFLALLARHGIQTVVDVRSVPYSRRLPQFQRDPLRAALLEAGLRYQFLGRELGGMPREPKLLDETGQVDYRRVGQTERFRRGIEQLLTLASTNPTAMLCAEEDPARCHRHLLIAPALEERGVEVVHIRGDGRLQGDAAVEPQLSLFD